MNDLLSNKYKTVWLHPSNPLIVQTIDQRFLPHSLVIEDLQTPMDAYVCIKDMHTRGAGLIGNIGAYGMYLAAIEASKSENFELQMLNSYNLLASARPTAVNLLYAIDMVNQAIESQINIEGKIDAALKAADNIADEDANMSYRIGELGLEVIKNILIAKKKDKINILTHCNAGWLAYIDYGTATAPIYLAHEAGINVHVWVDETRPRLQGANLTAWELLQSNIPHTIITDNAGGYLMQQGMVDMVIVGTDRTTLDGSVANKIGTYLKALAAYDNNVPFFAAVPSASIDWNSAIHGGNIPIELRDEDEIKYINGIDKDNRVNRVLIAPDSSKALNVGFDVTPARLITGLITERGVCKPDSDSIFSLFPEKKSV